MSVLQTHKNRGELLLGETSHEKEKNLLKALEQITLQLEDFIQELRPHIGNENQKAYSQSSIEDLEQRWNQLRQLQKKYGTTSKEILNFLEKIEEKISKLTYKDTDIKELREKEKVFYKEAKEQAQKLHAKREKALEAFCSQIRKKLAHLHMKGFYFLAQLQLKESLNSRGLSEVEFFYQTSPEGKPHPIAKCASGGELSRLLLALKSSVASKASVASDSSDSSDSSNNKSTGTNSHDSPRLLPNSCVFDEVDTGVSGLTAQRIGQSLQALSKKQQLIVITHLPQVASYAEKHFLLQKISKGKEFYINCKALHQKERVLELARLISGEKLSETSLSHAKQLLKEASPS